MLLKRHDDRVEACVDQDLFESWEAIEIAGVERIDLLAGLLEGGALFQAREVRPVIAVAAVVGFLLGVEGDRNPELDVGIEEAEVRRENADYRQRLTVDAQ